MGRQGMPSTMGRSHMNRAMGRRQMVKAIGRTRMLQTICRREGVVSGPFVEARRGVLRTNHV